MFHIVAKKEKMSAQVHHQCEHQLFIDAQNSHKICLALICLLCSAMSLFLYQ